MKRWWRATALGGLLLVFGAGTAYAQTYGGATTTAAPTTTTAAPTTTTAAPTTTTTPPTTEAPPPADVPATTSNPDPKPGDDVPISAPAQFGAPVIDTSKPTGAVLVPTSGSADVPMPQPTITKNADGSLAIHVTVPSNTPSGVYLITIVGTDASGKPRAIVVPVVVGGATPGGHVSASSTTASATPVAVPAAVRKLQASLAAEDLTTIQDAVLHHGATLSVDGARLIVHDPSSPSDSTRPLVAALAIALGGAGLVLLRRRTPAISRRDR